MSAVAATTVGDDDDGDFGDMQGPQATDENAGSTADPLSSAFGGLGPAENQPLPSMATVTTRGMADDFGNMQGPPATTTSGGDPLASAFDGLGTAENQPMPSMAAATTSVGDDDDFGDMQGPQTGGENIGSTADPLSSAFDGLGPAENQPLPSMGATSAASNTAGVDDDDDFGDMQEPQPTGENFGSTADQLSSAFDSLGPSENQPMPSMSAAAATTTIVADDDDFGDMQGPQTAGETVDSTGDPLSSAFDGLGPAENQPLPSMTAASPPSMADDVGEPQTTSRGTTIDPLSSAFDSLGPAENQPLPSMGATAEAATTTGVVDNGDFGDMQGPPMTGENVGSTADPLSSAFDGLGPAENQPLPQMATASVATTPNVGDDDAFGGMQGPQATSGGTSNDPFSSAFDGLGPAENQPLPSVAAVPVATSANLGDDDDFGDMQGPQATSGGTTSDPLASAFDGLGPAGVNSPPPLTDIKDPPAGVDTVATSTDPLSSAFDSLSPPENLPLPSMETVASVGNDDDFGEMQGTAVPSPTEDPLSSAFGSLGSSVNQPLPSLTVNPLPSLSQQEDDFGGFESAQAQEDSPHDPGQASSMPYVGKVAIPATATDSLGTYGEPIATDGEQDLFGAFSTTDAAKDEVPVVEKARDVGFDAFQDAPNSAQPGDTATRTFGAFGSVPQAPKETGADDSFGDFADASPPAEQVSANDEFGDFSGTVAQPAASSAVEADGDFFADFQTPSVDAGEPMMEQQQGSRGLEVAAPKPDPGEQASSSDDFFADFVSPSSDPQPSGGISTSTPSPRDLSPAPVNDDYFAGLSGATSEKKSGPNDDFADFKAAQPESGAAPQPEKSPVAQGEQQLSTSDDFFADFVAPPSVQQPSDDLGGVAPTPPDTSQSQASSAPQTDDFFADFSGPTTAEQPRTPVDDFAAFQEGPSAKETDLRHDSQEEPKAKEEPGDFFADFQSVSQPETPAPASGLAPVAPGSKETGTEKINDAGDFGDWGDFGASETRTPPPETEESAVQQDDNDDFGDFASFQDTTDTAASTSTKATPVATPEAKPFSGPAAQEEEFGDWDTFQDAPTAENTEPKTLEDYRDHIKALVATAESLVSIKRFDTGRNMDIVKSYERNLLKKSLRLKKGKESEMMERAKRCFEIMTALAGSSSNLPHCWGRIVSIVRDEMATAVFVLQEARNLAPEAQNQQVKERLQVFVMGLAEYVRLVRMVVATIADLMCLDSAVEPTPDKVKTAFGCFPCLDVALQVEDSWRKVLKSIQKVKGLTPPVGLETVSEIRSKERALASLCQLTLQPLRGEQEEPMSTTSRLEWEGKPFMACAANFWANKVSSTVLPQ